jgi:hypothetical protein
MIAVCAIVLQHGWLLLLLLRLFICLCCWAFVRVSWLLLPAVVSWLLLLAVLLLRCTEPLAASVLRPI